MNNPICSECGISYKPSSQKKWGSYDSDDSPCLCGECYLKRLLFREPDFENLREEAEKNKKVIEKFNKFCDQSSQVLRWKKEFNV